MHLYNLHSTMYLLNLMCAANLNIHPRFTFHYVYIKSGTDFHLDILQSHLHSTMYLLNPDDVTLFVFDEVFTFHYVSIKSF